MLFEKIQNDLNDSLLAHDADKTEALRYLMAQLKNLEIDQKTTLNDNQVVACVSKLVKQLTESANLFKQNSRTKLALQYEAQIKIYNTYLPEELSDEELEKAVRELYDEHQKNQDLDPKKFIGIAIATLKDKASPSRIVPLVQKVQG